MKKTQRYTAIASWMLGTVAAILVASCKDKPHDGSRVVATAQQGSGGSAAQTVAPPANPVEPPITAAPPRRLWTPEIRDEATLLDYSKELGGERFTKFVLDLRSDQIYYFDVDVYRVHKDFVFNELLKIPLTPASKKVFDLNYGDKKPEFAMCYLVHHLSADKWTLAFWAGDRMTAEHVQHAYKRMQETFYLGDKVAFRPDSARQEKMAKTIKDVPVIFNNELYQAANYQAFATGTAVGTLRIVPPGTPEDSLAFEPTDVVMIHESLSDISPVAGIITEEFSTPLSHVSLRARAWGIPSVGLKSALATYQALNGKTVFFDAKTSGHELREASPDEIAAADKRRNQTRDVVVPKADLRIADLRPLDQLNAKDVAGFGAKAANLGEIVSRKPAGFVVPPGFAIPISYYQAHLVAHGIDKKIAAFLDDKAKQKDASKKKAALAALRKAIADAPLDPTLLDQIEAGIIANATVLAYGEAAVVTPPTVASSGVGSGSNIGSDAGSNTGSDTGPRIGANERTLGAGLSAGSGSDAVVAELPGFFIRSSTNAEDLPGFNGAGLYDTMPNVRGRAALEAAVKQVWASVWNLRAFDERAFYGIDQRSVYGAILVQRAAKATSAGVMITAHPTDKMEKTTFTINAKKGFGMSVVDGKKVPEILLYNFHNDALRVVSRSAEDTMLVTDPQGGVRAVKNPNPGQAILSAVQARLLGRAGRRIVKAFPGEAAIDIEWVFVGDQLNIVQARPYVSKELE